MYFLPLFPRIYETAFETVAKGEDMLPLPESEPFGET